MALTTFTAKFLQYPAVAALGVWKGFHTMASDNKSPRLLTKIGTHNGVFHCDEALACFMLKQLPEYRDAEIVRTRDQAILDMCDIVVDVGGVYDPKIHRYDHHQRGFDHTLSTVRPDLAKNKHIKLSSAGLVYAHFGMEVISEILINNKCSPSTECLKGIYLAAYEGFVEELDAIDNGIPMYAEGHQRYRINTHLSARIHRLNPEWNSSELESSDRLFEKAMALAGSEFTDKVIEAGTVWWPAREIVKTSILNRKSLFQTGEIIELHERCPWKDHLLALEEEMGIAGQIKFVLFHDKGDSWRVQGIPLQPDSFVCRVFLHKEWRGVRDEQLTLIAGIKGCIFCHATGFIGGNKTKEGALEMAIQSLRSAAVNSD